MFPYRFYSLWDTGYAKIHIPIIASVSEHQPTTWFSFFFDLHILVATFPAGLWYVIKNINDERVFSKLICMVLYYFSKTFIVTFLVFNELYNRLIKILSRPESFEKLRFPDVNRALMEKWKFNVSPSIVRGFFRRGK